MDRYEQPVIFGLLNATSLRLVKHEELGGRQFMHSPTTTSNVQYSDRHQLLRSLLHAGQGVPSKALYRTYYTYTGCNSSCHESDDPRPSAKLGTLRHKVFEGKLWLSFQTCNWLVGIFSNSINKAAISVETQKSKEG